MQTKFVLRFLIKAIEPGRSYVCPSATFSRQPSISPSHGYLIVYLSFQCPLLSSINFLISFHQLLFRYCSSLVSRKIAFKLSRNARHFHPSRPVGTCFMFYTCGYPTSYYAFRNKCNSRTRHRQHGLEHSCASQHKLDHYAPPSVVVWCCDTIRQLD